MADITPHQARAALDEVAGARRRVADAVGLPQLYWTVMAIGWIVLGILTDFTPAWVATVATAAFGAGHAAVAGRLLDGRHAHRGVQVSRAVAGRRVPLIVIGILLVAVAVTIGFGFALDADGVEHSATWAAVIVAAAIGFGGNTIFAAILRRVQR
ncbi:hypothetical protein ACLQ3C_10070 [Gordonia sp. DT30]|uniref:hypothetical protein n=1 Tax=unclassified Gordonia (in: high G+C Gram-positive bacteria) TaxID=2657482 RepID=UPI003CE85BD6